VFATQVAAERRLVSMLFADLVGFTPLSGSQDPEEVRDLLSCYFETCRRLVEMYGGVVETFIGDAVMAVWRTPAAPEDDAERAVWTALGVVAVVTALVVTGEAAVKFRRGRRGDGRRLLGQDGRGVPLRPAFSAARRYTRG
jgi:class 3 adenylate cyclase